MVYVTRCRQVVGCRSARQRAKHAQRLWLRMWRQGQRDRRLLPLSSPPMDEARFQELLKRPGVRFQPRIGDIRDFKPGIQVVVPLTAMDLIDRHHNDRESNRRA